MKADKLRKKFVQFFISKKHQHLPSASLIPEDDPTILFTPAGMSPLVRYFMGEPHPLGKRLCSYQKCLRTDDIQEVGDLSHFTFFEMLGNWSLGDYFKKKAISWSFEFLTSKKWLNLNPNKIYVTVFQGDKDAPEDKQSIKIWQDVFKTAGIKAKVGDWQNPHFNQGERIFKYGKSKNWWGPAGQTGPCGPDTEMFYDTAKKHQLKFGSTCHPNCNCGRFVEIWNDVFMQYEKKLKIGKKEAYYFIPLRQKNVDTGLGLERIVALTEFLEGKIPTIDPFLSHLFSGLIKQMEKLSGQKYQDKPQEFRIISDHLRAAVFLVAAGVEPSNKDRGYVLRKLIRRAIDQLANINLSVKNFFPLAVDFYQSQYQTVYPEINNNHIKKKLEQEADKYFKMLAKTSLIGKKLFQNKKISGKQAFKLFATYGLSLEQLKKNGYQFNQKEFNQQLAKHQKISRQGLKQKFSGGLQDHSLKVIKLHTATHLLHSSLRKILGSNVRQVGSNITPERLRFDFTHYQKLSAKEIQAVENLVNEQIRRNLKITCQTMSLEQAQKQGALAFFGQKYPKKVKVYTIGNFSQEVCGGPHVNFTAKLGKFKIKKEESCGAGKRRIYAVLKK